MRAIKSVALAVGATLASTAVLAADLPSRKMEPAPVMTQLPAVDGINGKLEVFGGLSQRLSQDPFAPFFTRNQWRPTAGVLGSVSFPLAHSFGLQIDGSAATTAGAFNGGLGAHAFWRDPAKGLFGVYGSVNYIGRAGGLVGSGRAEGPPVVGPVSGLWLHRYHRGHAGAFASAGRHPDRDLCRGYFRWQ